MEGSLFRNLNESSLSLYLREIQQYPMLEAETERELALRYRDHGETKAAQQLAQGYLRLVVSIARKYRGYGLPLSDLIAEGNVGLMEAIKRFDPDKGARLATYAPWWIRAAIHDYVMRWVSVVRMGTSAPQKRLFFNLRRLLAAENQTNGGSLSEQTVRKIAKQLDVKESEVVEMNQRLMAKTQSLNALTGDETDLVFQDLLIDKAPLADALLADAEELDQRRGLLENALDRLSDRERDILIQRRLRERPMTLEQLGERYGVTRERIRQIELKAFDKVQKAITRTTQEHESETMTVS